MTGWHVRPDWRLNAWRARQVAQALEDSGKYRAEAVSLAQGIALVEVRSTVRPHPLVAKLRTEDDCGPYLEEVGR